MIACCACATCQSALGCRRLQFTAALRPVSFQSRLVPVGILCDGGNLSFCLGSHRSSSYSKIPSSFCAREATRPRCISRESCPLIRAQAASLSSLRSTQPNSALSMPAAVGRAQSVGCETLIDTDCTALYFLTSPRPSCPGKCTGLNRAGELHPELHEPAP